MSPVITDLVARLAEEGLALRKASPRGPDQLVLELATSGGAVVGGQWHRDHRHRDEVGDRTDRVCGPRSTVRVPDSGLLLQPGGADRRLPMLRALVARPGACLVAHRPERRAVVRDPDGSYTKVVRPGRTADVARGLDLLGGSPPPIPRVLDVDDHAGTVTLSVLPGPTLHQRLLDTALTDDVLVRDTRATGRALAGLHRCVVPGDRTPHGPDAELVAARRWLDPAAVFAGLRADRWSSTYERAAVLLSGAPGPTVLVHRDLHDKQLVVAPDGGIGMLDLDLATAGEAALDLANLLVHLRLRTLQGVCSVARSERCREALVDGYAPDPCTRDRLTAYEAASWLRLAGVYALRAATAELVDALLDEAAAAVVQVPQPAR